MNFPGNLSTLTWLQKKYQKPFLKIECGKYSYGHPILQIPGSDYARSIIIGEYCSIATECLFFVGRQGRHPTDTMTSYPIGMLISEDTKRNNNVAKVFMPKMQPPSVLRTSNLDLEIGHDVWIGTRVIVMAGVKIGTGAVVGAGSIVTRNIPPYAIVAGSPARIIRYRFEPDIIERLLSSKWWELSPEQLWEACGSALTHCPVTLALDMIENYNLNH